MSAGGEGRGVTAADVKAALRRRHPAGYSGGMIEAWTCLEEWANIDLLALNAWADADVIGYEVKVSRGDLRRELLKPGKRVEAVAMCTQFYFAVPQGLLTAAELAYDEPEWEDGDFTRTPCPGVPRFGPPTYRRRADDGRYGGQCDKSGHFWASKKDRKHSITVPVPAVMTVPDYVVERGEDAIARWLGDEYGMESTVREQGETRTPCPRCGGKGHLEQSRVEREAPTLWVPRDVGLVEIRPTGVHVVKRAPKRADAPGLVRPSATVPDGWRGTTHGRYVRAHRQHVNQLVRWTSARPDPRHERAAA